MQTMSAKTFYSALRSGVKQITKKCVEPKLPNVNLCRKIHPSESLTRAFPKLVDEHTAITKTVATAHRSLAVGFQDNLAADFQYIWLRDNCRCPKCRHPENRQKMLDTVSLNINIKPKSHQIKDNGQLQIVWPENDGKEHVSVYDPDWLYKYGKGFQLEHSIHDQLPPMVPWNGPKIKDIKPEISYDEVMTTDQGVKKWLEMLYKYGIAIMRGVPCKKDEVINVVERFAYIKKTKWGFSFDVLCEPVQTDPNHLAYTGMYLEHHTDMNYLEKSPGERCGTLS